MKKRLLVFFVCCCMIVLRAQPLNLLVYDATTRLPIAYANIVDTTRAKSLSFLVFIDKAKAFLDVEFSKEGVGNFVETLWKRMSIFINNLVKFDNKNFCQ